MYGGSKAGRQLALGRENHKCKGSEERAPGVIQEEPEANMAGAEGEEGKGQDREERGDVGVMSAME